MGISCRLSFVHSSEVNLIMKLCLLALVLVAGVLAEPEAEAESNPEPYYGYRGYYRGYRGYYEAGGDERDGLLTPSLKQLKPQFPDPHQTLKLSHVMDMDMAIHITDITGEERGDPLKPDLKHLK